MQTLENVHCGCVSYMCYKTHSKLTHQLTNVTEVYQTVLTDIHARSLLWQFYLHMHWTIFCTHCSL